MALIVLIFGLAAGYALRCFVEANSCEHDYKLIVDKNIFRKGNLNYLFKLRSYECSKCLKTKNVTVGDVNG